MLKQNVLDVLIYLFETYSDEDNIQPPDRDELELELARAGFDDESIAFSEHSGLHQKRKEPY